MTVWIDLPLRCYEGYAPRVVKAELLPDLAPHLAHVATFAISADEPDECGTLYRVTNVETGNRVSFGYGRDTVLLRAQTVLAQKTPEQVQAAMDAAVTQGLR